MQIKQQKHGTFIRYNDTLIVNLRNTESITRFLPHASPPHQHILVPIESTPRFTGNALTVSSTAIPNNINTIKTHIHECR